MKAWAANCLTLARIPLSLALLFLTPPGGGTLIFHLLCGVGDMLAGLLLLLLPCG